MLSNEASKVYGMVTGLLRNSTPRKDESKSWKVVGSFSNLDLEYAVPKLYSYEFEKLGKYIQFETVIGCLLSKYGLFNPSYLFGLTKDNLVACYWGNLLGIATPEEVSSALDDLINFELNKQSNKKLRHQYYKKDPSGLFVPLEPVFETKLDVSDYFKEYDKLVRFLQERLNDGGK